MKRWIAAAALLPLAVLSGCFTSEVPLIDGANADYPFNSLTIASANGENATLVREGDHYAIEGEGEDGFDVFFDDYGEGLYLVQLQSVGEDGTLQSLYAVAALDTTAQTVSIYRSIVADADFQNGIRHCVQDGVEIYYACLTEGGPLIAIVRAAIAAGEAAEDVYTIARMD